MPNLICYNDFKLFISLRIERPYLYIVQPHGMLVLSITSQEKARYPHKFKLELDCSCLDSEEYENSFANLNTKILIPLNKYAFIAKKYRINLQNTHNLLESQAIK